MSREKAKVDLQATIWNALSLDANFYEDAPINAETRRIARRIVILSAISHALGSAVILAINLATPIELIFALILDGLSVVGGYYFWSLTIAKIGQWLKPNHVTYSALLIPIGFAYAPQSLNFLTLIPLLGRPIELVLSVWSLLTVIIAVRQGLDIKTRWATLICLVGWPLIQIAVGAVQLLEQQIVERF